MEVGRTLKGQGFVEYAMILILVVVIVILLVVIFGTSVGKMFSTVIDTI